MPQTLSTKPTKRLSPLALLGLLPLGLVAEAQAQSAIEGVWLTNEKSEMTIAPCDGGYCGFISKIVVPEEMLAEYGEEIDALGGNFTDMNNKDPALRGRPIQGLQILSLAQTGGERYKGQIYNPNDGNFYEGGVEMVDINTLKLKGCVLSVLCQEQVWTRVAIPAE